MPVTQLDNTAALVVIDLQKGIVNFPTVHPAQEIIARAAKLCRAFRGANLPVVLVHVTGMAPGRTDNTRPAIQRSDDWSEFAPELGRQPTDHIIAKQRWGAFLGTNLDELLRSLNVTQIFLCGIATTFGVESTARSAYDLGYNVVLISDATTDRNADAHQHALTNVFPNLGQVDTTDNVVRLLETRK